MAKVEIVTFDDTKCPFCGHPISGKFQDYNGEDPDRYGTHMQVFRNITCDNCKLQYKQWFRVAYYLDVVEVGKAMIFLDDFELGEELETEDYE